MPTTVQVVNRYVSSDNVAGAALAPSALSWARMKDSGASGVNRIDVALIGEAEGRSDIGNRGFSRCVGQRRAKRGSAELRG
jgi:hypothetical protein